MKILITIVTIIAIMLLVAAILPKKMTIQVSQIINTPQNQVRDYVSQLKNQQQYSVRTMADPEVKLDYQGTDGTVWFVASRDSAMKNVGKWAQEITKIEEGVSYEVELRFEKPMQATNYAKTTLESMWNNQTKIVTDFEGSTPWPFNLMSYAFMPKLRKDMQTNLDNLKSILEK